MRSREIEERASRLWSRLLVGEADYKAVYAEAILPEIHRRVADLSRRIEVLDSPVDCGGGWRNIDGGTDLFYKQDASAEDCRQLFTPRWPVNENAFAWWKGMFTGEYFFRPEESPVAAYNFTEHDGALTIDTVPTFNSWVYLPSRRAYPTSYVLEFDYTVWQEMRETLQLCFSFDSLASRLRFVLAHNQTVGFEAVQNGMFLSSYDRDLLWNRLTRPCTLPLGVPTHVRLEVLSDVFQLFFNGQPALCVRLRDHVPHPAHWAIIAWNGFITSAMKLRIENLKVLVRDGD